MNYEALLSTMANWAAILTAVVAVFAYGQFLYRARKARRAVETYLDSVKADGDGKKSVLHLMRHLSMTEADVMKACFDSALISPFVKPDAQGMADKMLFKYTGKP